LRQDLPFAYDFIQWKVWEQLLGQGGFVLSPAFQLSRFWRANSDC
jgi:hypothetical protein